MNLPRCLELPALLESLTLMMPVMMMKPVPGRSELPGQKMTLVLCPCNKFDFRKLLAAFNYPQITSLVHLISLLNTPLGQ